MSPTTVREDAPRLLVAEPWHTMSPDEVEERLGVGHDGLTDAEAAERLARHGPNVVEGERQTTWWELALHQFRDPLVYILLIATAVTLILRDYTDAIVIALVVLTNAVVGFIQEWRAREAMRSLARLSAPHALVVRDGRQRDIESRDLVPGDIVVLGSGARVPADLRLRQVRDLEVDESPLTGESAAVRKSTSALKSETLVPGDQTNMAFVGTTITRGRGVGIVVRTGYGTELGRIATAMREVGHTRTPLQDKMQRFARQIGLAIAVLAAAVVAIGIARGLSAADIFLTAVAMAISAIPEGLPVVLTITLAVGVRRMARRRAIVRALPAVESLGSTTVIGSDKTGTLTKNEMTVRAVWAAGARWQVSGAGYAFDGEVLPMDPGDDRPGEPAVRATLLAGVLANEADAAALERGESAGDPTEVAIYVAAAKAGLFPSATRRLHRELDILPFEPERRFMATLNDVAGAPVLHAKGAPESVLGRCDRQLGARGVEPLVAGAARQAAAELAAEGMRVLAMAYRPADGTTIAPSLLESGWIFAGLVGMEDPVRPEAVAAVAAARGAGIRVLMLTGDHVDTARAIGAQVGLGGEHRLAIDGQEIQTLSDAELDEVLGDVDIYARVAPEHKLRIVQRLKHQGEIVAVTGDGVNDAPALRAAHLGIAMGASGTDVAREASDMVLADDNFATITSAVEEGRIIFANIRKVTFFLLSTAVGEVITIIVALLAGWPLPFVAAQILWINLVTNGLQDVALAFEPGEPGLLQQRPRPPSEGVLTRRLLERLGAVGLVLAAGTLAMFWWTWNETGDLVLARTMAMTQMVVFQFFHVFNSRSLDRSIFSMSPFSNRFLFLSLVGAALAHLAVLHVGPLQRVFRTVPLDAEQWMVIVLVGTAVIFGGELDKLINRRRHRPLG